MFYYIENKHSNSKIKLTNREEEEKKKASLQTKYV